MAIMPLSHLKLIDLSRQLPGPFCSMLLADMGVDTVCVSNPNDPMGIGIPFLARNKRHMTLNLKSGVGRDILLRLIDEADIVLEGYRPGVPQRLGIDYETLKARNSRLIYCSISGYGQDGPYRDRVGHDINYLGYAGVLNFVGQEDGPPVIPGVQIADIAGGALMATVGILTAIIAREKTGAGQFVDISMLDGSMACNAYHTLMWFITGQLPQRGREQLTGHWPCYSVYETGDGRYVTVGAFEPHFWATLCRYFGREDLIASQWAEGAAREEAFAFFRNAFRQKTQAQWVAELSEVEICFAPVNTLDETFADPQLRHRGMIVEMVGPNDPTMVIGNPIKLSETPASLRSAPPGFGEHTDSVLRGLGLAAQEIAVLRRDGVI
ncbi:MAG: CoA transferase [Deltaproteobacteria bacterium]|nr:CoA transferase [Deltaproteobacteria bacterium]